MADAVASEAGHWYAKDGTPRYETDGRPTTLRDARKQGLLPSVSMIAKCASAYHLEQWKRKRDLRNAIVNPYSSSEEIESYVERIISISDGEGAKVMDLGSAIHGCIECHLLSKQFDLEYKQHVDGALECLAGWCGLDGLLPEKSFAHPLGYGGKCDAHKKGWVADYKTKDFGPEDQLKAWDNHAIQLAAYREGFVMPNARCAIIYVSTRVPGLTHLVEVEEKKLKKGWGMFKGLLDYWQHKNSYMVKETVYA